MAGGEAVPSSIVFEIDWLPDEVAGEMCTAVRVCQRCATDHGLTAGMRVYANNLDALEAAGRFPYVAPACKACLEGSYPA